VICFLTLGGVACASSQTLWHSTEDRHAALDMTPATRIARDVAFAATPHINFFKHPTISTCSVSSLI
jgi:hypothetical protein